jgi:hypothetical protein
VWLPGRLLSAAAVVGALASPALAAEPTVSFEEQSVVVTGLPPGGEVSLFGISRGYDGLAGYELRHDALLTADGEGTVRYELDLPVSLQSVWSAVDLSTGEVGLGVPEDGVLRLARSQSAFDAERRTVTELRRFADIQWVRPGAREVAGVWGARLGDGAAGDEDGLEDLSIRAPVSAFAPVRSGEESPVPDRLAPGDVVVVIDPQTLEISVTRLPEPTSEPKS